VENTRYDEFTKKLRLALAASQGSLVIALRVDGEMNDSNILLRTPNLHERIMRVQAAGGQRRADTWNIVTMITDAVMRNRPLQRATLPVNIQGVFEEGINKIKRGWVVLTVENWVPMGARLTSKP